MASRFIFQKFSSGMSRSTSLLGAHVSSSARAATTPGTLSNVFHGAAVHHPSNRGIHGFATRYLDIFPCSLADAKTSWKKTGMPSAIIHRMKPAFLGYARGVKQTFSSSASNNHRFTPEAEKAAWQAEDPVSKTKRLCQLIKKDVDTTIALLALSCVGWVCILKEEAAVDSKSKNHGSSRCLNCCHCQCHGPNPKVEQD